MIIRYVSIVYQLYIFSTKFLNKMFYCDLRCQISLSVDIITLHDGNVNSIDFNCNNSVNIVSEIFKIASFVETCKIM